MWYRKNVRGPQEEHTPPATPDLDFHNVLLFTSTSLIDPFCKAVDDLLQFILAAFEIVF